MTSTSSSPASKRNNMTHAQSRATIKILQDATASVARYSGQVKLTCCLLECFKERTLVAELITSLE